MSAASQGFDVFDCHHHVGEASGFMGELAGRVAEGLDAELAARLAIMDRGGVRQAAVIPGHGYERPEGIADTRRANDRIAQYRDRRPDRFPVAIGIVEPLHGAHSLAEIERCARELSLAGLSFHARFQGVSMDDARIRRYVGRMGELGLVPVLHALTESVDESLWKIAELAGAFPEFEMLVLDAFSAFDGTKECSSVAARHRNLLFDTSLSYNFDFIEAFARRFGAQRVVFGTDLYSPPLGRRVSHLLPQILESGLPDADKTLILGANARRLFRVGAAGG
jgi:predicted TIM-barrel fold metal-dependent hydrolase